MDAKARWQRELGRRISEARGRMTQRELAEVAGVAANTLARIERGEMCPSAWALAGIAYGLGVQAGALLPSITSAGS